MTDTRFAIERLGKRDVGAVKTLCARVLEIRPDAFPMLGRAAKGKGSDLVFLARAGRKVAGAISCGILKRGRREARLDFVAVGRKFRRQGAATALMRAMETELKRRGVRLVSTRSRVFSYGVEILRYPAVTTFLLKAGFDKGQDVYDMEGRLSGLDCDTTGDEGALEREGVGFRRILPGERGALRRFLEREFPNWIFTAREVRKRGRQVIHVALKSGRLVGFSVSGGNGFGPIGVAPRCREKGIGRILLLRCLADIRERGHLRAFIGWANFPFYAKTISAPITRLLWQMEKRLSRR